MTRRWPQHGQWPTEPIGEAAQRLRFLRRGHGLKAAFIRRLAHFRPAAQIRHTFAHGSPLFLTAGVLSLGRKTFMSLASLMVVSTRSTVPSLSYILTEFSFTWCLMRMPSGRSRLVRRVPRPAGYWQAGRRWHARADVSGFDTYGRIPPQRPRIR